VADSSGKKFAGSLSQKLASAFLVTGSKVLIPEQTTLADSYKNASDISKTGKRMSRLVD